MRYNERLENKHIANFVAAIIESQLTHYASDLYPELGIDDDRMFLDSLARARQVCATLKLPVKEHFKKVYRYAEGDVYCDYKLSYTAYVLVSINGDVSSRNVARVQMELVKRLLE